MKYLNTYEEKKILIDNDNDTMVEYYDNGNIKSIKYYKDMGNTRNSLRWVLHREDGAAKIEYYENGNIDFEGYYINGKEHRDIGASSIYYKKDGSISYKNYCKNGKLHREDGAALIFYQNDDIISKYYINDIEYTFQDFVKKLKDIGSPHYEHQKLLLDIEEFNL